MTEVRVMAEGTLRVVQGSGSGRTWATGTSPGSGLIGYVRSFSFESAQTVTTVMERGIPDHNKVTEKAAIKVNFDFAWTGSVTAWTTAAGTTIPHMHLEWRASAAEIGATSAFYYEFMGAAVNSLKITEDKAENKVSMSFIALAMSGANASGFLS